MNIREALLEEKIQTRVKALAIAHYACSSPKYFKELMQCFVDKESRLAQRAAWSVSWAAREQPALIIPHIKTLVAQLERTDISYTIIRNSVGVLEAIDIPKTYHGRVMNACFRFIETPSTPVAIKAFALTTLYHLSLDYPEIQPELCLIITETMNNETAAFKSRGRKILQMLEKAPRHIEPRNKIR